MIKKALCVVLAFCMLFTVISVPGAVLAAGSADGGAGGALGGSVAAPAPVITYGDITTNSSATPDITIDVAASLGTYQDQENTVEVVVTVEGASTTNPVYKIGDITFTWNPDVAEKLEAQTLATGLGSPGVKLQSEENGSAVLSYQGSANNANMKIRNDNTVIATFYLHIKDTALGNYANFVVSITDSANMVKFNPSTNLDHSIVSSFTVPVPMPTVVATIEGKTVTYDGQNHNVSVSGYPADSAITYTYDDEDFSAGAKDAGTYEVTVTVEKEGYNPLEETVNLVIETKPVEITGVTATNRDYDGTNVVEFTGGVLSGKLDADTEVSFTSPSSATINDANVGNNKSVTFSEPFALSGEGAGNYTLSSQPVVSVNITPADITVRVKENLNIKQAESIPTGTDLYDVEGLVSEDTADDALQGDVEIVGLDPVEKEIGEYDVLQGELAGKGNYEIVSFVPGVLYINDKDPQLDTTFSGLASEITAIYGDIDIEAALVIDSNVSGEVEVESTDTDVADVTYAEGTVTVTLKNAGTATVKVTVKGNAVYLDKVFTSEVTVEPKDVTLTNLSVPATKIYDASDEITVSYEVIDGVINEDVITLSTTWKLASKDAGEDVAVIVPELEGETAVVNNYNLNVGEYTVDILKKQISAQLPTFEKEYDKSTSFAGVATLSDVIGEEKVTASVSGNVYSANVATYIDGTATVTLGGDDCANYQLAQSEFTNATVVINPKTITVSGLVATSRKADGTTDVAITGGTYDGVIDGDDVTVVLPTQGTIETADVGNDKAVSYTVELTGGAKDNYILQLPVITVNITSSSSNIPYRPSWNSGATSTPSTPAEDDEDKEDEDKEDEDKTDDAEDVLTKATADVSLKENASEIRFIEISEDAAFDADASATRNDVINALNEIFNIENPTGEFALTDVEGENADIVELFTKANIIAGYEDGTFRGENEITRAEFLKILTVALGIEVKEHEADKFDDISEHWSSDYVNSFVELGYILGYPDGTFRPDNSITFAEMIIVINRVIEKDVEAADKDASKITGFDESHWAYNDIMAAIQ